MRTMAVVVALAAVACGPGATMTMANAGTPVMLGPVQRVGGGRGVKERVVGTVEGEASEFVAVSETRKSVGNGVVEVNHKVATASTNAKDVSAEVDALAEGHRDRDARIDEVTTGAWAYITVGAAAQHRWVGVKGRVVEVTREN